MEIDHLSYSRVSTYLMCPQKFKLRYVDQLAVPLNYRLFLGGTIHLALRNYFRQKIRGTASVEKALEFFKKAWRKQDFLAEAKLTGELDWQNKDPSLLKDYSVLLLDTYLRSEAAKGLEPVAAEFKFERELESGINLVGRVDLISAGGKVIDFKTTRRRWRKSRLRGDLQPVVYALGMGGPLDFEYHFMIKSTVPKIEVERRTIRQEAISWLENALLPQVWSSIQAGVFPPVNPTSWMCRGKYCDYFKLCPFGMKREKAVLV